MRKIHPLTKCKPEDMQVTFGAVTVLVRIPDVQLVKRNIKEGQDALMRAQEVLVKPGVKLQRSRGKPIYFASPDRLDVVVREVDGIRTLGKFVGGRFRVFKQPSPTLKTAMSKKTSKIAPVIKAA